MGHRSPHASTAISDCILIQKGKIDLKPQRTQSPVDVKCTQIVRQDIINIMNIQSPTEPLAKHKSEPPRAFSGRLRH